MSFPCEVIHGPDTRHVKFQMIFTRINLPQKITHEKCIDQDTFSASIYQIYLNTFFMDLMALILRDKVALNAKQIIKCSKYYM